MQSDRDHGYSVEFEPFDEIFYISLCHAMSDGWFCLSCA